MVRAAKTRLLWHDWYAQLSDLQRADNRTATSLYSEGEQLFSEGQYVKALGKFNEAASIFERIGQPPCQHQSSLHLWLANSFYCCDREQEALIPALRAYDIACKSCGTDSPDALHTLLEVAKLHQSTGEYSQCIKDLSKVFHIYFACFGEPRPDDDIIDYEDAMMLSVQTYLSLDDGDKAAKGIEQIQKLIARCNLDTALTAYRIQRLECKLLRSEIMWMQSRRQMTYWTLQSCYFRLSQTKCWMRLLLGLKYYWTVTRQNRLILSSAIFI